MKKRLKLRIVLLLFFGVFFVVQSFAQQMNITGVVKDAESGDPLPGATVVIQGTSRGTATDVYGNFEIEADQGDVLVFTFIGYNQSLVTITDQAILDVQLSPSTIAVDELVVIGYGKVKKTDATGSVTAVSSKDFNQGAITTAQELLVGKTAGVRITTSGGAPGSGSEIRIRGGSSLLASNDPLIVIDGIPISGKDIGGGSNILSFVNPNDIETMTILKDASATAIYGSRASNGVIIITTKKGAKGTGLKVNYDGYIATSTPIKYLDVYSGDEMRDLAFNHLNIFDVDELSKLGTANTNWQEEIFRSAFSHNHNLGLSGSLLNTPYRASVGYTNQEGILKNTDMERVTATLIADPSFLDDDLKVSVNVKGMSTKHNFGDDGAIGSAVNMDPTQSVYDESNTKDGYFQWENKGINLGTPNPVEQALAIDNRSVVNRLIASAKVDYKLPMLREMTATLNVATDYTESDGHNNRPVTSPSTLTSPTNGKLSDYSHIFRNDLLDFYVNYNKDLNILNSNLDVTAGYSWQHFQREGENYTRGIVDADNEANVVDSSSYINENYLVSFFGRVNYSIMSRYLFTATVRNDGSSKFSKENQWGFFPSAAFAWKINEEAFLADVSVISELKLRLGWGITGQQDIIDNDYPAQPLYRVASEGNYYMIGGQYIPTLRPDPYDPNIKWEETTTYNVGIDYGLFNNRLTGSVEFYHRITEDLLNEVTIPTMSNFKNKLITNVGSLENTGVELGLSVIPVSTENTYLNLGFNFTYNENEITKLLFTDDPEYLGILYGDGMTGFNRVTRVGHPFQSFFLNKQIYDNEGNPIEGLYADLSGEGGTVNGNDKDKYIFHNPAPDYIMGFSFRFNYKQFDMSGSARANIGNYVFNMVAAGSSYDQMNQLGYWKTFPKYLDDTQFVKRQFTSDYFVQNASFMKVDNITAGYTFANLVDKMNARISFTVQNALTITKYEGLDPEVQGGIDNNFYPRPRTFMLGISLTY